LARELLESLNNFEIVASCTSAIEASLVLKGQRVDLMFLDIEMPVLKGTDFYGNLLDKPKVIFNSAYRDYAVDGFVLDSVDYLLNPIVFARFFQVIECFLTNKSTRQDDVSQVCDIAQMDQGSRYIFVRKDRKQAKIQLVDIVYVQSLKDYVKVFLEDGSHIIKQGISAFEALLGQDLIRTHRSYIINQDKVTALTNNDVELNDIEVPISKNYKAQVFDIFKP